MYDALTYMSFNDNCYYVLGWILLFASTTAYKLYHHTPTVTLVAHKENLFLEELPGLAFITLHTVAFVMSPYTITRVIYLYWGPLYFVTAYLVVFKYKLNWKRIATISSISCKLYYVAFVAIFYHLGYWLPIYMYSIWIMHDQVRLAWFKNNADRTRRLCEDWWLPRVGYPLGLAVPFYYTMGLSPVVQKICCGYSVFILITWLAGIARLLYLGLFFIQPKIEGFGRDIVYL